MKRLPYLLILAVAIAVAACNSGDDDVWEEYSDWRETNEAWILEQATLTNADGTPYYEKLVPAWNPQAYVLIHYFNDREDTEDNLSPMLTSTVDVKYYGRLYNDEPFDSSYANTQWGDSIFRTTPSSVIEGWAIALQNMRVGDSCEVVIPYQQAYYTSEYGIIIPFSALKFNLKLVDIPYYEISNPQ